MSKVILKYIFMFDPVQAWSHLSQFESDLRDFFAANGLEAEIVESVKGQMGESIMLLKRMDFVSAATNNNTTNLPKEPTPAKVTTPTNILNQMRGSGVAPKFKEYQDRGVPKKIVNQEKRSPKLSFNVPGRTLRRKVRY